MSDSGIRVMAGGRDFQDWNRIRIRRENDALAGSFELNFAQRKKGFWPLKEGDAVRIFQGSFPLFSGYAEVFSPEISSSERSVLISGRDKTADLIDCTVSGQSQEFRGSQPLSAIIKELLRPFDLASECRCHPEPFLTDFKADPGEKVISALERISEKSGVFFQSSGDGTLLMSSGKPEDSGFRLEEGRDLLSCQMNLNQSEIYSEYSVRGFEKGEEPFLLRISGSDMSRFRPLELVTDTQLSRKEAEKKLIRERSLRAARSMEVTAELRGWNNPAGEPWKINSLITLHAPSERIHNERLLICAISLNSDEEGSICQLSLCRPSASP